MYIEGVALEHFSALPQTEINSSTKPCQLHAVFHSFLSDDCKQDSATTTAHIKHLIELFKKKLTSTLSTIWENTDGFADQYRCTSALYLMSVLPLHNPIIIDWCISAPRHGKEVVDGLNAMGKRYMYQLMSNVQLLGSRTFDSHILMHSFTPKNDVSLAK